MIGKCLCGQTVIQVNQACKGADICYCGMCRTWASGPAFYLDKTYKVEDFEFVQGAFVKEYDSSKLASRGFCSNCGTSLYWRGKKTPTGDYAFNLELFQITDGYISAEFSKEDKPDYYNILKK